ncbi:MAG TPA: type VI secretion system protein TssA, partial [Bryobacteraceae bacterium]
MPLRNDLLSPISADNPGGENLRYSPIYDKIKEARREEDPKEWGGDWQRTVKVADWPLTIKLASDALATKSKDLWLAAWLTEAMLRREGIPGLQAGLGLIKSLIEIFWDGLFPELEDGDSEFRASPLRWLGDAGPAGPNVLKIEVAVRSTQLTKSGYTWIQFRDTQKVGHKPDSSDWRALEIFNAQIAEGKMSADDWDKDFDVTPKKFYLDLVESFDATLELLGQLTTLCDEKFVGVEISFRPLQNVLEEVRQSAFSLLNKKRETEPDEAPAPVAEPEAESEAAEAEPPAEEEVAVPVAAAAPVRKPKPTGIEPQDVDDAIVRIVAAAKYLRQQDAYNPVPYLILRGLRWGELRAGGGTIDQLKLAAPPSEIRQSLKKLSIEGNWAEVLETAETAMGMECGRGWLDLQRYVARACNELGYYYAAIRTSVISTLKGLLTEYPQLPEFTMMDDTPTANPETVAWLKEEVVPPPPPEPVVQVQPEPEPEPEPVYHYAPPAASDGAAVGMAVAPEPDAFELAMKSVRAGRPQEGLELLMREMMQEPSGRGRFLRKVQVAQLCLGMGNETIALPILQEAVSEIERRKLEEWEAREMVAHPLGMLYRCLAKSGATTEERQRLYSWICRLDP